MRCLALVGLVCIIATGCSRSARVAGAPRKGVLFVFRQQPPALVELAAAGTISREIPIAIPAGCSLDSVNAPPLGETLAVEFSCSFGQAVILVDTATGVTKQPVTDSDSHFMAWTPDGRAAYLKVNTLNRPRIVLAPVGGSVKYVPLTELAFDIAPEPAAGDNFLFSFSRGMGLGSEMWYAENGGQVVRQVLADPNNYLSLARWSPDASRIAFIKIPDSATPFTVGELRVMQANGSNAHRLADADAGHGFAPAWSPDGARIAFVVRENARDAQADQDASALRSNITIVDVGTGAVKQLTSFTNGRVEAPGWSPDGKQVAFTAVVDDRMNVYLVDVTSGQARQALAVPASCPVWLRK